MLFDVRNKCQYIFKNIHIKQEFKKPNEIFKYWIFNTAPFKSSHKEFGGRKAKNQINFKF